MSGSLRPFDSPEVLCVGDKRRWSRRVPLSRRRIFRILVRCRNVRQRDRSHCFVRGLFLGDLKPKELWQRAPTVPSTRFVERISSAPLCGAAGSKPGDTLAGRAIRLTAAAVTDAGLEHKPAMDVMAHSDRHAFRTVCAAAQHDRWHRPTGCPVNHPFSNRGQTPRMLSRTVVRMPSHRSQNPPCR